MDNGTLHDLEARLWEAANTLWAGAGLKQSEYSGPVLGLIFLKFADARFADAYERIEGKSTGRKKITKTNYHAEGVLYLPDTSRYDTLLQLPDSADMGKKINEAMKAVGAS